MHLIAMLWNVPAAVKTHTISLEALRAAAVNRPPGYAEEVIRHGVIDGGTLLIEDDIYVKLCARYRTSDRVPRDRWPGWAREFAALSRSGDTGIGDVVVRVIGPEGSYGFKAWMKKTLNRTCAGGCVARLNSMYPLP